MKVRKHILYVAALAIVGALSAACSSGTDMEQAPQQKSEKTVILHGTVNAKSANATTRSVDANGITAWVSGEKIAVYYQKTNDSWDTVEATVGTPNSDGSAPITATLENPKACTVKLVYPASLANTTGSIDNTKLLNNQKGTISDISSNFDAATGSATITVSGSEATIPNFTMENQVCICKFTLKDASSNALNVTQFVINDGTNTYTVNPSPATSEITVAMLPATSANFSFTATTVSGNYKKSVASATLVAGKLYTSPMTLTLAQGKLLSSIAENAISYVGYAVCNHGYCFSGNTLPTECESNGGKIIGMICYVGTAGSVVKDENNTAINTYKGLIIGKTDASGFAWADNNNNTRSTSNSRITSAYANSSENCYNDLSGIWYTERMNNSSTWGESYAYYAGGKAISIGNDFVNGGISGLTSGWFLPSIGQWYRALNGIYKSEVFTSSTAINVDMGTDSDNWKAVEAMSTALVNAGCTGLSGVISGLSYYWTSSEYDSNNAVNLLFHSSEGVCVWKLDKFYESAYSDVFVRPFLAF